MIKISDIRPGDRIGIRTGQGNSKTRTVERVGKDYVMVNYGGGPFLVFAERITSHVKCG